jgi:hypothetical protein
MFKARCEGKATTGPVLVKAGDLLRDLLVPCIHTLGPHISASGVIAALKKCNRLSRSLSAKAS